MFYAVDTWFHTAYSPLNSDLKSAKPSVSIMKSVSAHVVMFNIPTALFLSCPWELTTSSALLLLAWRGHEDIDVKFSWNWTNVSTVCVWAHEIPPQGERSSGSELSKRQRGVPPGVFLLEGSSHGRNMIPSSKNKAGHRRSWWVNSETVTLASFCITAGQILLI